MTNPTAFAPQTSTPAAAGQASPAQADPAAGPLAWLLEEFLGRVPGAEGAVLVSRDGLKLAAAGLTGDRADTAAALVSGMYSLARGVGQITTPSDGTVQQVAIQHDARWLFIMSAADPASAGLMPGSPPVTADPRAVGCLLGVLAEPDAESGPIAYQMSTLIGSVADHLVTATRLPPTGTGESLGHDR